VDRLKQNLVVSLLKVELGRTLDRFDLILVASLVLLTAVYSSIYFNFAGHPAEDAAILMRYSKHLAEGHGIVWNVGEQPVDGATDFLPMVLFAALSKFGMSLESAVRSVDFSAHVLTVIFIYLAIRELHGSSRWIAWISAGFLAIGPGLRLVEAYFATPLFLLFCCVTWYLANKLLAEPSSHMKSIMFALSSLTLGLVRPEGVFLAVFFLLGFLYVKGLRRTRTALLYFCLTFTLLGGAYFLWRWNYFGYPLPNPFYKKGGGHIYLDSLKGSIRNIAELTFPFNLAFIYSTVLLVMLALRRLLRPTSQLLNTTADGLDPDVAEVAKRTIFPLIPIVGFTALWIFLSDEMNYYGRFQYVVLPIVLLSWPVLIMDGDRFLSSPRLNALDRKISVALALLIVLVSIPTLANSHAESEERLTADSRYDAAVMLSNYEHNYTMAVSEAGLLPLYSGWNAIDTWGLNDPWIAHQGEITETYLDQYKPEVIVLHEDHASPLEGWNSMVMVVKEYAEKNGYILAATYGENPQNVHHYYVRGGFPDSTDIAQTICEMDYIYNSRRATNYAIQAPCKNRT
jgi:hypothetical protein